MIQALARHSFSHSTDDFGAQNQKYVHSSHIRKKTMMGTLHQKIYSSFKGLSISPSIDQFLSSCHLSPLAIHLCFNDWQMPLPGVVEIQNSDTQREHFNLQSSGKYLNSSSFLLSHFNLNIIILTSIFDISFFKSYDTLPQSNVAWKTTVFFFWSMLVSLLTNERAILWTVYVSVFLGI